MRKVFSKQNRALLAELVRTDFKLRYQGSALGYAWSLLRPLLMFAILYVVFAIVFKLGDEIANFPVYLLLGIVLWNFFHEMTSLSLSSIVARGDLIRKIRIPRWLIILSASVGALINLLLNLVVVLVIAAINGLDFMATALLLPVFILEIYIFSLGVSLVLSAMYVKYRDVTYIWDVLLQAGFYATPILYPVTLITNEAAQRALFLNPLAQAIQGARSAFVTTDSITIGDAWGNPLAVLMPLAIVLSFLIIGVLYFKREARTFAENL
jgi:ABC-2 type transport system permease protein